MILVINVKHHDNQISGEGNEGEKLRKHFSMQCLSEETRLITDMLIFGDTDQYSIYYLFV